MTTDSFTATAGTVRTRENPLLRWALITDGAVSAVNGLAYVAAANAVGDLLELPVSLLVPAGVFLVVYGLVLIAMARRPRLARRAVAGVVVLNALWVVDSLVVASGAWFDPGTAGVVWLLMQAAVVAAFAVVQAVGMRRAG
ncbi:hypothetical protein CLV30_12373 [Haloactinopolyspora alba]|uniref:Integral membrane protein n=1 Tax=Haloactinopolyspora alba TaxID=648780 RepID=A0A2P8DJA1_9ACTN|nr:hypothetical protein [Haloactinopolyspora alba]PSK97274.1 hypothetical protein CLV30_12373 [Haloactinopolyspora alba]